MTAHTAVDVLIIDDDETDRALIQRALSRRKTPPVTVELEDGEAAVEYLLRRGRFNHLSGTPLPRLVLCDLKLPFRDGIEVVRALRSVDSARATSIIIFSSSDHQSDVGAASEAGADSYAVKPGKYEEFVSCVLKLAEKWLGCDQMLLKPQPV